MRLRQQQTKRLAMGTKEVSIRGPGVTPIPRTSSLTPWLLMGMLTTGE